MNQTVKPTFEDIIYDIFPAEHMQQNSIFSEFASDEQTRILQVIKAVRPISEILGGMN